MRIPVYAVMENSSRYFQANDSEFFKDNYLNSITGLGILDGIAGVENELNEEFSANES